MNLESLIKALTVLAIASVLALPLIKYFNGPKYRINDCLTTPDNLLRVKIVDIDYDNKLYILEAYVLFLPIVSDRSGHTYSYFSDLDDVSKFNLHKVDCKLAGF